MMKWAVIFLVLSCTVVFGVLTHVYVNTYHVNTMLNELLVRNLSNLQHLNLPDSFVSWYNGNMRMEFVTQNVPLEFDKFVSYVYISNDYLVKYNKKALNAMIKNFYDVSFFYERIITAKLTRQIAVGIDYYILITDKAQIFSILISHNEVLAVSDITDSINNMAEMGRTYEQYQF
jgi:hypothetical protein